MSYALIAGFVLAEAAATYSLPWQLRPAAVGTVARIDTAVARSEDTGTSAVMLLYGSYRITPRFAPFARLGVVDHMPASGEGATAIVNPAVGGTYVLWTTGPWRATAMVGITLPIGMGGGDSPDPDTASAAKAGIYGRAGLDNAMFAVNDVAVFPGVDVAWVDRGFTVQAEATVFGLRRARGADAQPDEWKANLTSGLAVGYAFGAALSTTVELRYQRWLSTPSFVDASDGVLRDSVSVAAGLRTRVALAPSVIARPGIALAVGLDDPMSAQNYTLLLVDLPVAF